MQSIGKTPVSRPHDATELLLGRGFGLRGSSARGAIPPLSKPFRLALSGGRRGACIRARVNDD